MDEKLKSQLIAAREDIGAQLEQLEGTSRGIGDCRSVYADLQRELKEIDTLLEADGTDVKTKSTYEPAVKWFPDGTVGNPTGATKVGKILAIVMLGSFVLYMGATLLRAIME